MSEQKKAWWDSMIAKHGSEKAVRAFMSESRKLSRGNQTNHYLKKLKEENPELLREISRRGGRGNNGQHTTKQETKGQ